MMADPGYDLGVTEARGVTKDLIGKAAAPNFSLRALSPSLGQLRAKRLDGAAAEAHAVKPALEKYAGDQFAEQMHASA
jgi:hypothetical protein